MSLEEYVRQIGQQFEESTDPAKRVELAQLLAATASADAQPYLLDAMAEEEDERVRFAIKEALRRLGAQ